MHHSTNSFTVGISSSSSHPNSANERSKLRSTISLAVPHNDVDMDDTDEEKNHHGSIPSISLHKGKTRKVLVRSMSTVTANRPSSNLDDVETHHQANGGGHRQHTKHGSLTMSKSSSYHFDTHEPTHTKSSSSSSSSSSTTTTNITSPPQRTTTPPYHNDADEEDHQSPEKLSSSSTTKLKRRPSHSETPSPTLEQHSSSGEKKSKKRSLTSINKKSTTNSSSSSRLSTEIDTIDNDLSLSTDQLSLSPSNSSSSLTSSNSRTSKSTKRSESHTTASRTKKLNTSQSLSLNKSSSAEQDS